MQKDIKHSLGLILEKLACVFFYLGFIAMALLSWCMVLNPKETQSVFRKTYLVFINNQPMLIVKCRQGTN